MSAGEPLVLLRAKSGPSVGLGHLMRTRAVAEEVRAQGGAALCIVDDEPSAARLRHDGFEAYGVLARPYWPDARASGAWLDGFVDWTAELRELARRGTPSFLVENRTAARKWCRYLVQPSLHHQADAWERAHAERVLSGPRWIPLAPALLALAQPLERDVDVLVSFGGSDPLHSTERVLAALEPGLAVVVSAGAYMDERRAEIESLARSRGARVLAAGESLWPWMARARVALTALGTTLYELAYLLTPALILANYEHDAAALGYYREHGPHRPLGFARELGDAALAARLRAELPPAMATRPAAIAGLGQGASALAERLLGRQRASLAA